MKKIIFSLLAFVSITGVCAQSPIFDVNGIYYRLIEDTTLVDSNVLIAAVTNMGDADHYKGEIIIPSTVSHNGVDYTVGAITDLAFKGSRQLSSVSIPATVTQIPVGAFYGCNSLSKITVDPENGRYDSRDNCNAVIETATNTIVAGCNNTVFPSSVPNIGECAFYGCKGMTSLTIPESITSIGNWAFLDCTGLLALSFPSSVESLEANAFMGCENIETLEWNSKYSPQVVTAFAYQNLKNVLLGDSVNMLSYNSFANCTALVSIELPAGLEVIDRRTFAGCTGLTSISIPSTVNSISYDAFDGCSNIETVYWNYWDSVAMSRLFDSSKASIKTVIIGDAVTCIEPRAFEGFTNLTSILVDSGNTVYDNRGNCNAVVETETNRLIVGCKTTTIPEGVERLEEGAFAWCGGPATLTLPSSLLSIGSHVFSGCDGLTSIVIPENVNSIAAGATAYCKDLISIKVVSNNPYYNSGEDCNSIIDSRINILVAGCKTSVIPSGVKGIGQSAFEGIEGLTEIKIPSSVESIGSRAFAYCDNLGSLSIPDGVTSIASELVRGCGSLVSIDIPSSVKSIGDYAFYDCSSLESVIIPEGVTDVSLLFNGCNSLTYLSLPSTATIERNRYPFSNNPGLKSAGPKGGGYNLEFSWDTIPGCAFNGMMSLRSVYIPKSVKLIDNQGVTFMTIQISDYSGVSRPFFKAGYFEGCDSLESLAISFSDTKIMRRLSADSRYIFENPADYYLYLGTPIHRITFLDDTIKSLSVIEQGMIDEVTVSEYVKRIYPRVFNQVHFVKNIEVENGNTGYSSADGVLLNKAGTELIAYPSAREMAYYYVPNNVTRIADYAFSMAGGLKSVTIPRNVEYIGNRAFDYCQNLESVTIAGTPEIGEYAFWKCNNINTVVSRSMNPGKMDIIDTPSTIMAGDFESNAAGSGLTVTPIYNEELARNVTEITQENWFNWSYPVYTTDVPAGSYKISMGILPSSEGKPNYIHPVINGITEDGEVVLLDSTVTERVEYRPGRFRETIIPHYVTNDITVYDTVVIADTLVIPDGIIGLRIILQSGVNERNQEKYSRSMLFDRFFFKPLDNDIPAERYAGPFTEKVFNQATLYVPDGAVNSYQNADGWKLFKHIAVDTNVYPADEIEVNVTDAGYATFYYSDADYALPQGLYAMVVSGITTDGRLSFETIATGADMGVIPAGTAVILATDDGKAGTFKLQLAGRSYGYSQSNLLIGTDVDTLTYAYTGSLFYKLALGPSGSDLSGVPGWYWGAPDGGAFQIEAHKAWLAIPKSNNTRATGYTLLGNPTFIIDSKSDVQEEAVMYDLYGRRLYTPVKQGLMIINGRKVYIGENE